MALSTPGGPHRWSEGVAVRRRMMNGKIHRARVTDADLNYVGSISIDPILMKAADIVPNEQVSVYNLNNGARLETYAIEGTRRCRSASTAPRPGWPRSGTW